MSDIPRPFMGSIERAVMALLATVGGIEEDSMGGDLSYDADAGSIYVHVARVPGGRANKFEGDFIIDLDVFDVNYLRADSVASAIEAILLGYPHRVVVDGSLWVFDKVTQNTGPADLPWEDDRVHRLGATYVITARRR